MKPLKLTFLIILVIVVLFLLIPLFLPDTVTVTQKQCMHAAAELPFRQVNIIKNWENWSPFTNDTTTVITYNDIEMGEGASYNWKGEQMGKGSLTIVTSNPYDMIRTAVDFGPEGSVTGIWDFTQKGDSVCVSWSLKLNHLTYPFGRWLGLMIESGLRPMMMDGLLKMKAVVEAQSPPVAIEEKMLNAQPALMIIDSTTLNGLENMISKTFTSLYTFAKKRGIKVTGPPFAVYFNRNPEGVIGVGAGIPVDKAQKLNGTIGYFELPAGKTLHVKHFGFSDTFEMHRELKEYIKEHHLKIKDFIWEVFVTGPPLEKDTAQWETDIYYPVEPIN